MVSPQQRECVGRYIDNEDRQAFPLAQHVQCSGTKLTQTASSIQISDTLLHTFKTLCTQSMQLFCVATSKRI